VRNPLRRWGFRIVASVLRRASKPREFRFQGELVWVRASQQDDWQAASLPGADQRRHLATDPTWVVELLEAACTDASKPGEPLDDREAQAFVLDAEAVEAYLPTGVKDELFATDTTGLAKIHLEVAFSPEGTPKQISVLVPLADQSSGPVWEILEFTAYGIPIEDQDLWHDWQTLRLE
jgi:hypothetical protein